MAPANLPERIDLVVGGAAVSLLIVFLAAAAVSLDEVALAAFAAWAAVTSLAMLRPRGG